MAALICSYSCPPQPDVSGSVPSLVTRTQTVASIPILSSPPHVGHALAAQIFYRAAETHCLELRPVSAHLGGYAGGIEDTAAGKRLADRHARWAADMPRDVADLWGFVAALDRACIMALLAHCASLTVNAVKLPHERKPVVQETANRLASALALDMTAHWKPTAQSYLGRVTKGHILAAVREAVDEEATQRLAGMKKQALAEAAEALLRGSGWLPTLMRTQPPAGAGNESEASSSSISFRPRRLRPSE